jgi:putative membrane protein
VAFLTDGVKQQLDKAIKAIEAGSSIEVMIAVRQRLRRWPSANAAIGVMCALSMLAFELYSEEFEFDYWAILVFPVLAGMTGGLLVELVPTLQRALTPRRIRKQNLLEAARATFLELGVHKTRGRTGLLVFVAVRDRAALLVGDVAVEDKVGKAKLDRIAATIAAGIPQGGEAVARALHDTAPALAKALPRAADDIDELADLVHAVKPQRGLRRFVR